MSRPVRLEEAAERELEAAHARYEAAARGLGEELADEVGVVVGRIAERPRAFPLAAGIPRKMGVRRAVLSRFPFSLFFMEHEEGIIVLAVAHQLRRPGYWRRRVSRQRNN